MPADGGASSPVDVTRAARRLGIVVVAAAERRVNRVQPTIAAHSTARRFKHEIAFMIVIFIWLQNHTISAALGREVDHVGPSLSRGSDSTRPCLWSGIVSFCV